MIIAGQWEVLEPLGEGGMGMVYKVRHSQMQEIILAIKMLSPELMNDQYLVARFQREGSVMARFRHKHSVRVFSKGVEYDGNIQRYFILMEYIQGKTLREHLRDIRKGERKPFSLAEVLEISRQVAEALTHAHNQTAPIVHRDIKPGNIMLENSGKDDPPRRAVVMDWGIAKEVDDASDLTELLVGSSSGSGRAVLGTPKYCAPEQMRSPGTVTGSADIYSLGMVIYEMYTGEQFFADLDTESVVRTVRDDPEEHDPRFPRNTPAEFATLVWKAIAKSRSHRYQRMEDLLHDVERCRRLGIEKRSGDTLETVVVPPEGLRRRRQEEEQRATTLKLQKEAAEAREKAVREGAGEWAATLFQQGVQHEEEGAKRVQDRNYFPAQEAYDKASRFFKQAHDKAVAVTYQKAEQARNEMLAVKAEVERYRVREKARRRYTAALALEDEAGELWERKWYRQAREVFAKAKSAFEDACELAVEALRREAEGARESMEARKRDAEEAEAAELARGLFEAAEQQAKDATAAFTQEDFTQAQRLYEAAARQYIQALQQAQTEPQRRELLAAQRRATDAARQQVLAAKETVQVYQVAVEGQWVEAQRQEERGDEAYQREEYEAAQQAYDQATQQYTQVQVEGEQLQHVAEQARTQAEQARAGAEQAQAQEYAPELFQQAEATRLIASQAQQAGRYGQGATQYEAARRVYETARAEAETARQARDTALAANHLATQAQKNASGERADQYAPSLYQQAVEAQAGGEEDLAGKRWVVAAERFGHAQSLFAQAGRRAQEARAAAQRAAEAARAQAEGEQRAAAAGEQLFPERWAEAATVFEQTAQALVQEDPQKRQSNMGEIAQALRRVENDFALEATIPQTFVGEWTIGRATDSFPLVRKTTKAEQKGKRKIGGTVAAISAIFVLGIGGTVWIVDSQGEPLTNLTGKLRAVFGDSTDPVTQRIEGLLSGARQQEAEERLTTPAGDNALETYRKILQTTPEHEKALAGVRRIKDQYLLWGKEAEKEGDWERAQRNYKIALEVAPHDKLVATALIKVEEQLSKIKKEVRQHITIGNFYFNRGQYKEAIAEFEGAKALQPRNQEISDLIQRVQSAWNAEKKLGVTQSQ